MDGSDGSGGLCKMFNYCTKINMFMNAYYSAILICKCHLYYIYSIYRCQNKRYIDFVSETSAVYVCTFFWRLQESWYLFDAQLEFCILLSGKSSLLILIVDYVICVWQKREYYTWKVIHSLLFLSSLPCTTH